MELNIFLCSPQGVFLDTLGFHLDNNRVRALEF